jgi:hypothetical protein
MRIALILAVVTLSIVASAEGNDEMPNWLLEKIKAAHTKVTEHLYKGKHVFLFAARCCDIPTELFDESGKRICVLGGGFANFSDKKCDDFSEKDTFLRSLTLPVEKKPSK